LHLLRCRLPCIRLHLNRPKEETSDQRDAATVVGFGASVFYPSSATIQGFNMPNRVVLATSAKAGDKFEIAIFGINGPISVAPPNFIWFREARVEFYK
jgi:hypothetical protein